MSGARRFVLSLAGALVIATSAAAADAPKVLLGRSIGAARMGASEAAVVAGYGEPVRTSSWRVAGRSGPLSEYAVPGGKLYVYFDAGRVVALETTSRRYRLSGSVGVGTVTPRRPNELSFSWRGFRYDACSGAYRRHAYRATTELVLPFAATTGRRIVAVAMADDAHLLLLPGAARCD